MEMHKDIQIGEYRYRIGRFTAKVGSWIITQILSEAANSEAEFARIQEHCLSVCFRYEGDVAMPVVTNSGAFAIKELEHDLISVLALTAHAKQFNFASFFQGDGLKALAGLASVQDSNPSNIQP